MEKYTLELELKTSSYLAGRIYLGEEAAKHFFDSNEDGMKYLKSVIER